MSKHALMIAGPNGAGKTTIALELLSKSPLVYEFINADEIARGLAPLHPESMALSASKLMLKRLKELLKEEKSFAFETTASGTNYLKHLREAKSAGYKIHLTYLWLSSPSQAVKRVAQRVKQGGHYVEKNTIIRRYRQGIKNLVQHYLSLVDSALIVDNSSKDNMRKIIASKSRGHLKIIDPLIWREMEEIAFD
jgi:predicted ABC-type ATPase